MVTSCLNDREEIDRRKRKKGQWWGILKSYTTKFLRFYRLKSKKIVEFSSSNFTDDYIILSAINSKLFSSLIARAARKSWLVKSYSMVSLKLIPA